MATFDILVLPGDGIGPEVTAEGVRVLEAVGRRFEHVFNLTEDIVGGACIDAHGVALRPETLEAARASDALLFGAVGGPKWDDPTAKVRPEQGLLALRSELDLWANLRPVKVEPALLHASSIKADILEGADMLVIRELTSGIYFGKPQERRTVEAGARRCRHHVLRRGADRADRAPRLPLRAATSRQAHQRRQGRTSWSRRASGAKSWSRCRRSTRTSNLNTCSSMR